MKNIFTFLLILVFLVPITFADVIDDVLKIQEPSTFTWVLPSNYVEKGFVWNILSTIFDTSGRIENPYVSGLANIHGRYENTVPKWNWQSFIEGGMSYDGNNVNISGDISAQKFCNPDGSKCFTVDDVIEFIASGRNNSTSSPVSSVPTSSTNNSTSSPRSSSPTPTSSWPSITYRWQVGEWSKCSATCWGWTQTRWVHCKSSKWNFVDVNKCWWKTELPQGRTCNTKACDKSWSQTSSNVYDPTPSLSYWWRLTSWSNRAGNCGTRKAYCFSSKWNQVSGSKCGKKPRTSRKCKK